MGRMQEYEKRARDIWVVEMFNVKSRGIREMYIMKNGYPVK